MLYADAAIARIRAFARQNDLSGVALAGMAGLSEIGRASCRDRVL